MDGQESSRHCALSYNSRYAAGVNLWEREKGCLKLGGASCAATPTSLVPGGPLARCRSPASCPWKASSWERHSTRTSGASRLVSPPASACSTASLTRSRWASRGAQEVSGSVQGLAAAQKSGGGGSGRAVRAPLVAALRLHCVRRPPLQPPALPPQFTFPALRGN